MRLKLYRNQGTPGLPALVNAIMPFMSVAACSVGNNVTRNDV